MTTELYENELLFTEKILLDKSKLEEENKQLKSILTELEKWLSNFNKHSEFEVWEIENKIQKLKEKYK